MTGAASWEAKWPPTRCKVEGGSSCDGAKGVGK